MKAVTVQIIIACLALCVKTSAQVFQQNDGILFEITGENLTQPSYIMGTFHDIEGSFVHDIAQFDSIFSRVTAVAEESDIDALRNMDIVEKFRQEESRADSIRFDSTLYAKTLGEQISVLDSVMMRCNLFPGYRQTHPYRNMQEMIWHATTYAMNEEYFKAHGSKDDFLETDIYISRLAKRQDKTLLTLDSVEMVEDMGNEAIESVREQLSMETAQEYIDILLSNSRHFSRSYDMNRSIGTLYREGHGAKCLSMIYPNAVSDTNNVRRRNDLWMEKIPAIIQSQPTLIVVGLGHLMMRRFKEGLSKGLITELRMKGYTINKIY